MFSLTNKTPLPLLLTCLNCPKKSKRNLEENEFFLRVYTIIQYYWVKIALELGQSLPNSSDMLNWYLTGPIFGKLIKLIGNLFKKKTIKKQSQRKWNVPENHRQLGIVVGTHRLCFLEGLKPARAVQHGTRKSQWLAGLHSRAPRVLLCPSNVLAQMKPQKTFEDTGILYSNKTLCALNVEMCIAFVYDHTWNWRAFQRLCMFPFTVYIEIYMQHFPNLSPV